MVVLAARNLPFRAKSPSALNPCSKDSKVIVEPSSLFHTLNRLCLVLKCFPTPVSACDKQIANSGLIQIDWERERQISGSCPQYLINSSILESGVEADKIGCLIASQLELYRYVREVVSPAQASPELISSSLLLESQPFLQFLNPFARQFEVQAGLFVYECLG